MTRFRIPVLVSVLLALALVACGDKKVNVNQAVSVSPTAPTSSPPSVTGVAVSTPSTTITLNACPATITFAATVYGTGVTQTVSWEKIGGGDFKSSGTAAALDINSAGTYIVTARSTQNADVSGSVTVTAVGNCGGSIPGPTPPAPTPPSPPGPGDTRTISISPHGGTGAVGSTAQVTATCRLNGNVVDCSPRWNTTVSDRVRVEGTNVGRSVMIKFISPHAADVCAEWEPYGVRDCGTFTGTESTPAPPPAPVPQCRDGADNDGDGKIDFPADPGCSSPDDNDEWNAPPPPPTPAATCPVTASPMSIPQGGTSVLSWTSANATTLTASGGWSGSLALSGTRSVVLSQTTTFTVSCTGPGGSGQSSVTVTVTAAPPPNPCAGASASLPDLTAKGQTVGFTINVQSGCQWILDSNNHHVVSVNPSQGTGPSAGTVTSLNSGTATIRFLAGGAVVSSRTYVIP